jgi:hypothetical protein
MTDALFRLPALPADVPEGDFHTFYRYWASKAPHGALPGRRHIDPLVDLPQLIPRVMLLDVVSGGDILRFRIRVSGDVVNVVFGCNPAGRYVEDFILPERQNDVRDAFTRVAREPAAHYWENQVWAERRQFIRMQRLALPLADDGVNVDMIFALYNRIDLPAPRGAH